MTLEHLEGTLDVVIFGDVYRAHRAAFSGPGPYVVEETLELDTTPGEPVIRAERLWPVGHTPQAANK